MRVVFRVTWPESDRRPLDCKARAVAHREGQRIAKGSGWSHYTIARVQPLETGAVRLLGAQTFVVPEAEET